MVFFVKGFVIFPKKIGILINFFDYFFNFYIKKKRYASGIFNNIDIQIEEKGNGYPYHLFQKNKEKIYQSTLNYKNTCNEIVFAPIEERHLLNQFDRFIYKLQCENFLDEKKLEN